MMLKIHFPGLCYSFANTELIEKIYVLIMFNKPSIGDRVKDEYEEIFNSIQHEDALKLKRNCVRFH